MREELFVHSVLGSASAGIIARLLCHPIDTCKSKIQFSDSKLLAGNGRDTRFDERNNGIEIFLIKWPKEFVM